jgi:hypothetical protein
MIPHRARHAAAPRVAPTPAQVGYFTDDVNLYRVVAWLRRPGEPPLAEVENCSSLTRDLLAPEDLARLSVRLVSTAGEAARRGRDN